MVHILPQRGTKFDHVISARYQRESNLRREGSGKVNFHYKTRGTSDKGVHYTTILLPWWVPCDGAEHLKPRIVSQIGQDASLRDSIGERHVPA